jgi:hypothetical protein
LPMISAAINEFEKTNVNISNNNGGNRVGLRRPNNLSLIFINILNMMPPWPVALIDLEIPGV